MKRSPSNRMLAVPRSRKRVYQHGRVWLKSIGKWLAGIGFVVVALWIVKFFSETEMRRLDKEVGRLCAIDGRSVIYETVKLPPDKFNQWGQPMVPQGGKDDTGFGYFVEMSTKTLAGPGQAPGARLIRDEWRVIRQSDGRVIAERISYTRGGGYWLEGFPGVGHGTNCPERMPVGVLNQIFFKE